MLHADPDLQKRRYCVLSIHIQQGYSLWDHPHREMPHEKKVINVFIIYLFFVMEINNRSQQILTIRYY